MRANSRRSAFRSAIAPSLRGSARGLRNEIPAGSPPFPGVEIAVVASQATVFEPLGSV
jgi:hypothetical protein